jgi:glycosyltransferase involved in cell wall biosynthesis
MRISILNDGFRNCGGCLQLIKYANLMQEEGHEVSLVYDTSFSFDLIPVAVPRVYAPTLDQKRVPDADVIISSSWYMTEKLTRLPRSKGEKFAYIQDFETWSGTSESIIQAWRLPAHKIAVASYLQDMIARHVGVNVPVIPYGIDFELFQNRKTQAPEQTVVIGALYNSMPRKRFHDIVACVRLLLQRGVSLHFLCFGTDSTPCLDIPFTYLCKPSRQELRDFYDQCQIWLALSEQEGLHIPPMEAMASGVVPVTTSIGGMRDYCRHLQTGMVVDVGDVHGAANAVVRICREPNLWKRLSDGAVAHIQSLGSERDNAQAMSRRFEEVLLAVQANDNPLFSFTKPNKNIWATCDVYVQNAESAIHRDSLADRHWAIHLANGVIRTLEQEAEEDLKLLDRLPGTYGRALSVAIRDDGKEQKPIEAERMARFSPEARTGFHGLAKTMGLGLGQAYVNAARFDGMLRIYPTLRCNLRCPYCVNDHVPGGKKESPRIPGLEWAAAINRHGRHVVITGGEPFLLPDLVDMINAIDPSLIVRVYTNLSLDVREMLDALRREVRFYVSWHPRPHADYDQFLANLDRIQKHPLLWADVHAVRAKETEDLLPSDLQHFSSVCLHIDVDDDQRSFIGSIGNKGSQALCRRRILLVGPDGQRYQCVSNLMRRKNPMENVLHEALRDEIHVTTCQDFGLCAPCDGLGETSIVTLVRE